jgi:hypothetical protein
MQDENAGTMERGKKQWSESREERREEPERSILTHKCVQSV